MSYIAYVGVFLLQLPNISAVSSSVGTKKPKEAERQISASLIKSPRGKPALATVPFPSLVAAGQANKELGAETVGQWISSAAGGGEQGEVSWSLLSWWMAATGGAWQASRASRRRTRGQRGTQHGAQRGVQHVPQRRAVAGTSNYEYEQEVEEMRLAVQKVVAMRSAMQASCLANSSSSTQCGWQLSPSNNGSTCASEQCGSSTQSSSLPSTRSSSYSSFGFSGMLQPRVAYSSEQIMSQLEEDSKECPALIEWIISNTWPMATNKHSCRLVQKALEVVDTKDQIALAEQFRGHVWDAIKSPHANHVLQLCVELAPADRLQFVIAELKSRAVVTARHRFGCRVLQRLLEHCQSWQTVELVDELLCDVIVLSKNSFGNYVLKCVLEHGTAIQRMQIVEALLPEASRLSKHWVGSHVIQKALIYCASDEQKRLRQAILADPEGLPGLASSQYGSFVVRELERKKLCLG